MGGWLGVCWGLAGVLARVLLVFCGGLAGGWLGFGWGLVGVLARVLLGFCGGLAGVLFKGTSCFVFEGIGGARHWRARPRSLYKGKGNMH